MRRNPRGVYRLGQRRRRQPGSIPLWTVQHKNRREVEIQRLKYVETPTPSALSQVGEAVDGSAVVEVVDAVCDVAEAGMPWLNDDVQGSDPWKYQRGEGKVAEHGRQVESQASAHDTEPASGATPALRHSERYDPGDEDQKREEGL